MAKKQHPQNRSKTSQHCFRLSEVDSLRFEELAATQGQKTVAAWAAHLVQQRAKVLDKHFSQGLYLQVENLKIPCCDISEADPVECRLSNAQRILEEALPNELGRDDFLTLASWIHAAFMLADDAQAEKAKKLAEAIPDEFKPILEPE